MTYPKPRKRSNRQKRSEKPAKKTKAFKTLLKDLDKRKRHFIGRMISRYQMTEQEAQANWKRVHPDPPEVEVEQIMTGKKKMPEYGEAHKQEEKKEEKKYRPPDYLTESLLMPLGEEDS